MNRLGSAFVGALSLFATAAFAMPQSPLKCVERTDGRGLTIQFTNAKVGPLVWALVTKSGTVIAHMACRSEQAVGPGQITTFTCDSSVDRSYGVSRGNPRARLEVATNSEGRDVLQSSYSEFISNALPQTRLSICKRIPWDQRDMRMDGLAF